MPKPLTLEHQGARYERFDPQDLVAAGVPQAVVDAASLAQAQAEAVSAIDGAAADARGRYITTTPGQADVYAAKLAEANAYVAAGSPAAPEPGSYPLLSAQAVATGQPIAQTAAAVITANTAWVGAAGKIEALRVPAKAAVRAATTPAAVTEVSAAALAALAQV